MKAKFIFYRRPEKALKEALKRQKASAKRRSRNELGVG